MMSMTIKTRRSMELFKLAVDTHTQTEESKLLYNTMWTICREEAPMYLDAELEYFFVLWEELDDEEFAYQVEAATYVIRPMEPMNYCVGITRVPFTVNSTPYLLFIYYHEKLDSMVLKVYFTKPISS